MLSLHGSIAPTQLCPARLTQTHRCPSCCPVNHSTLRSQQLFPTNTPMQQILLVQSSAPQEGLWALHCKDLTQHSSKQLSQAWCSLCRCQETPGDGDRVRSGCWAAFPTAFPCSIACLPQDRGCFPMCGCILQRTELVPMFKPQPLITQRTFKAESISFLFS